MEKIFFKIVDGLIKKIGNRLTTTGDLNKLGKSLFKTKYVGTFAWNQLPQLNAKKPYAIINLDDSTKKGSHWVALAYKNRRIYIYDSFGRNTKKILPNMQDAGKFIMSDPDSEQKRHEVICGHLSLAWLIMFDKHGLKALRI